MRRNRFLRIVGASVVFAFALYMLSGCMMIKNFFGDKDDDLARSRIEKLSTAIKNEDREAIKSSFSAGVKLACDLDKMIDALFSFIEGDVTSWELNEPFQTLDNTESGKTSKQIIFWFTMHTEKQRYLVLVSDFPINSIDPDNEGLASMMIIRAADEAKLCGSVEEWIGVQGITVESFE